MEVGLADRDLSEGVSGLERKMPTTENLAILVWDRLERALADRVKLERVRLFESPDLFVDYSTQSLTQLAFSSRSVGYQKKAVLKKRPSQ